MKRIVCTLVLVAAAVAVPPASAQLRACPQGVDTDGSIVRDRDAFYGGLQARHVSCAKAARVVSRLVSEQSSRGYRCLAKPIDPEHSRTTCRKGAKRFSYRAGP